MDKRNMGASVLKRSPGIYTNVVALIKRAKLTHARFLKVV